MVGLFSLQFRRFKTELLDLFGDEIEVTGFPTPGITGSFEVEIVGGKILHSKKNGNGYVDTQEKLDRIIKGVEEALAA
ncbi:hypothetical protein LSH36_1041g00012 [Paralvinella palmiformis]|uniref:Selenoprotein W n=1 Tax=Paralvinella palmiformis TaxID=53620 RepID=A0AAD9IWD8_9ANNE|nr:hypothetical protein LSH36_1041g00012 [Paralvinella palmiformis]